MRRSSFSKKGDDSQKKFTVYDDKCAFGNEGTTVQPACNTDECQGKIIQILYANYGLPNGSCPRFSETHWCTQDASQTVQDLCLGKENCDIDASNNAMGRDPCPGHGKRLYVTYQCECSVQQKKISEKVFQ